MEALSTSTIVAGPTSYLENLPTEILVNILAFTDAPTLINTARSSRFLYNLIENDILLVSTMMLRQIGPTVLPDAVLAHNAPRNASGNFDEIRAWCAANLEHSQRPVVSPKNFSMSLKTANAIWGLHQEVRLMVPMMINMASSRDDCLKTTLESVPVSDLETDRFYRTLYRFETFHKLADNCYSAKPLTEQHPIVVTLLHRYYGFVDVAQQTCVAEMLSLCAATSFNNVASKDILWGAKRWHHKQCSASKPKSPHLQYLVTRGLHNVYRFLKAMTYTDQATELTKLQPAWGRYRLRDSWILQQVQYSIMPEGLWRYRSITSDPNAIDKTSTVPSYADLDPGPANMAEYARTNDDLNNYYSADGLWFYDILRERGYAMWDQKRLNMLGINITRASINDACNARNKAMATGRLRLGSDVEVNSLRKLAWYRAGKRGRCPDGWPAPDTSVGSKEGKEYRRGLQYLHSVYDEAALSKGDPDEGEQNDEESWLVNMKDSNLFLDKDGNFVHAWTWVGDWD